jgi:Skp family chaperone for outer membrane proteins
MKHSGYLAAAFGVCLIVVIFLLIKTLSLSSELEAANEKNNRTAADLQASFKRVEANLAKLNEAAPGLGEYMTTIQLHAGKLWFAAKALNWELAEYELDELKETMEAAKGLDAEKNGVKISNVLDSVLQTQVAVLDKSLKSKSQTEFQRSYDEILSACNGCHESAGYKFIHIVRPTAPPVTNQRWEVGSK